MEHFYYSFVLTLLHSLWQAALLLCIYFLGTRFLFRLTPLQKRNTAYLLLLTQSLMSIGCFMVLFNHLGIGILLETLPKKLFSAATPQITAGLIEVSFFAYLAFFVSKLIRLGFSLGSIWSLSKKAGIRPHPELTVFTTQKAYHLGIRKKVSVWYSAHVKSALTYGVLKPVILLPISLVNQLSLRETEAIILHELNHIKQQDFGLNLILQFVEILYCFNPFILKLIAELKLEREKNCDIAVLQFNYPMVGYAEALLKSVQQSENNNRFLMNIVFGKKQLLKRIEYFSSEKNRNIPTHKYARFFLIPLSIMALVLSLQFRPGFKPTDSAYTPALEALTLLPENDQLSARIEKDESDALLKQTAPKTLVDAKKTEPAKPHKQFELIASATETASMELVSDTLLTAQAYRTIPVAFTQTDSIQTSELVITEENSSGQVITSVYRIIKINGEFIVQPLWMVKETSAKDSLQKAVNTKEN